MDAKEKGKKLVGKFRKVGCTSFADAEVSSAKKSALIAVEEILSALYNSQLDLHLNSPKEAIEWFSKLSSQIEFYKKVKEEIQAL